MTEAQENYGKKIEFDADWKGPLGIQRRKTDLPFLVGFGVFLLFWLGIAIYAYSSGDIASAIHDLTKREINYDDSSINATGVITDTIHHLGRDKRQMSQSPSSPRTSDDITPENLYAASNVAVGFAFFGIFLSVAYILLLRWFATFIVFTAIILICAGLFTNICIFSYFYASTNNAPAFMIPLLLSIVFFLIVTIFFFIFRKKIKIACEVIREACKVVMFFPSSLFFPILPYLLYAMVFLYGGSVLVYMTAIPSVDNQTPGHIYFFHIVNIFGVLWTVAFITAYTQMVLSGSFATWFWSLDKRYIPNNVIVTFMVKATKYHLGTVAFGSFIVAIFQLIKIFLNFISNRLKGSCNPCCCCLFGWYKFIFGRLERFLRYLNSNAYIMCTIHGTDYWQSAKDALNLLMRNIVKVLIINKVTDAILVLGQLFVIGLSVLATWGYCKNAELYDMMAPAMTLVAASSFLITVSFFIVLRTAIDTIFLCAMEDYERNDGSEERPYYMSFKLRELLLNQ